MARAVDTPPLFWFQEKKGGHGHRTVDSPHSRTKHKTIRQVVQGFGVDYVKCFDLIPQQIVLCIACRHAQSTDREVQTTHTPF